jgi:hypothetical protein
VAFGARPRAPESCATLPFTGAKIIRGPHGQEKCRTLTAVKVASTSADISSSQLVGHEVDRVADLAILGWLLAQGPHPIVRWQAERLAKMGDRCLSKIGKAKQCLV